MRVAAFLSVVPLLTSGALAQVPGNQNGLHFFNQTASVGIQSFPNYLTTGNVAGDCTWKILSSRGMKRASHVHNATAAEVPVFNNTFVAGGPLNIPDVQFRPTTLSGACIVPDFAAAPIATIAIGNIVLPSQGAFTINVDFSSTPVALPDGDSAVCYLAVPGEVSTTPNSCRPFVTTGGTDPGSPAGCTIAKSGRFSAATSTIFTQVPAQEFWLEVAFSEPTVQPVRNRATTPNRGYGAYNFRVSPAGTDTIGWHVEAFQHIGQIALPIVSFIGTNSPFVLGSQSVCLDLDLLFDALIVLAQAGPVVSDGAAAPFTDGVFDTFNFPVPVGVTGASLHVAFFFFDTGTLSFTGATNSVSTTFVP